MGRHHGFGRAIEQVVAALPQQASEVAVGDHAAQATGVVDDRRHAEFFRADLDDHVPERRGRAHRGDRLVAVHNLFDREEQALAQRAAGMIAGEILGLDALVFEQRHRQRVAQRQGRRRAGGGREVQRAGLFLHADIEHHVAVLGQHRLDVAGQADHRHAEPLDRGENLQDLFGLAAVGEGDDEVAARHHAEVAVDPLGGMQEDRRHADARERGGDLAADDPRFPHAGYDHAALAPIEQRYRLLESLIQTVDEREDRVRLDLQHLAAALEGHRALMEAGPRDSTVSRIRTSWRSRSST